MIRKIRLTLSELNSMYIKLRTKITRFPTGVDNMGGALQNLMGGGGGGGWGQKKGGGGGG